MTILTKSQQDRVYVLHPEIKGEVTGLRTPEDKLEEAINLTEAINVDVVAANIVNLPAIKPGTFIGTGKAEEIKTFVKAENIDVVMVNTQLSPKQQSNLEKSLSCKVIDRTALILEIFGDRAATKEGRLQVELASLEYQKSRLVRSWTHLERQRGGAGFMGGPGERQIESDRRILNDRITQIKRQLEKVTKTRTLHRQNRDKVPYPIVALVGYTNAGKSTLFNKLTGAKVMSKDMLFATLDPTMREIVLPSGLKCILSDTVGFISDLPTQLVAAFRATLEEVIEADVILHIRDIASASTDAEKEDVLDVLHGLEVGEDEEHDIPVLEVWNKIDLLEESINPPEHVQAVSALTGEGCDDLLDEIDEALLKDYQPLSLKIPASEGKILAWLHTHALSLETTLVEADMQISGLIQAKDKAKLDQFIKEIR